MISFEPDRLLYYKKLISLGYMPEDVQSFSKNVAAYFLGGWRKKDKFVVDNYVNKIITLSDYVSEQTKAVYPNKPIKKEFSLFVYLDKFIVEEKDKAREKINNHYHFGLQSDDFVILSQSRVEKSKGILEIVEAVQDIIHEGSVPHIKLLIGGKGRLFEAVKQKVRDNQEIHVLGFVPEDLLSSLFSASTVLASLGRKETGGPLTLLEALYARSLPITSNEAGPAEIITDGKTGFLVDARDKGEIKKKIKAAYELIAKNKKKYAKMLDDGVQLVKKEYSFDKSYKELIRAITS